jgi:hypothetical protein
MWGTSTPMQTFLEENMITTLFFGGVNIGERRKTSRRGAALKVDLN